MTECRPKNKTSNYISTDTAIQKHIHICLVRIIGLWLETVMQWSVSVWLFPENVPRDICLFYFKINVLVAEQVSSLYRVTINKKVTFAPFLGSSRNTHK